MIFVTKTRDYNSRWLPENSAVSNSKRKFRRCENLCTKMESKYRTQVVVAGLRDLRTLLTEVHHQQLRFRHLFNCIA